MQILERSIYRGPNLFDARPVVRIRVDLEALEATPSDRLPGFPEALLAALPGLVQHGCSLRSPGGFARRLRDGTWMGHVIEHVALELQVAAGVPVTRGKTRSVRGRPGVYDIMYRYSSEATALAAGRSAVQLTQSLLPPELRGVEGLDRIVRPREDEPADFDLEAAIARLRQLARKDRLGPTTQSLVTAARRRGVPAVRIDDRSLIRLGQGARQKLLRASITSDTSHLAVMAAGDKNLTKTMLAAVGAPTPRGAVVTSEEEAVRVAAGIGGAVVLKPLNGNHGRGVDLGLETPDQVRWAFTQAARHGPKVIVEEQYGGRDYRVLVVGGKIAAVAERRPAHVVGDGVHTVAELIEQVNQDPRRGVGHETVMTRIVVDAHVEQMLARAGLGLDGVPAKGAAVQLRATANMSTGGTAIDRTDEIHPVNASIAERAAASIGLDVAGIDFIAPDISRSVRDTGGGIVEVNAAPGFRMHLEPSEGKARDVGRAVIEQLYPAGARSRIPVIAVTGTNGKSTVIRMTAAIFRAQGLTVGLTNTSGVYINDERVSEADASGPKSARRVLADPTVEVAVLETARGGILREGLAFDRCDVGVALNIADDHLGLGGVDTLEDLARVKSVVVEAVGRRGTSVLNGDDPLTLRMARRAGGRVVYFTMSGGEAMSPLLQKHLASGGVVFAREPGPRGGELVICEGENRTRVMAAADIPATLTGAAEFNVQNALAAIAVGHAQRVPLDTIRAALASFHSSFQENPGRLNVWDAHGFRIVLDYAHNPAAMAAMGDTAARLRTGEGRIIGVVSIPGDRRDEDIREMGRLAAGIFDQVVFRERPDGRGRAAGEVLDLLRRGALEAGMDEGRIQCIPAERPAIDIALKAAAPGDLVIIFPTNVDAAWKQIVAFKSQAASKPARPEAAPEQDLNPGLDRG